MLKLFIIEQGDLWAISCFIQRENRYSYKAYEEIPGHSFMVVPHDPRSLICAVSPTLYCLEIGDSATVVGTHFRLHDCPYFHSTNKYHSSHNKQCKSVTCLICPFSNAYLLTNIYVYIFYHRICISWQSPGLNVITEYILGLIMPGKPIANVCFKTYGYISMAQAVSFLQDFKLGHYMKIPPRSMFVVQVITLVTTNPGFSMLLSHIWFHSFSVFQSDIWYRYPFSASRDIHSLNNQRFNCVVYVKQHSLHLSIGVAS